MKKILETLQKMEPDVTFEEEIEEVKKHPLAITVYAIAVILWLYFGVLLGSIMYKTTGLSLMIMSTIVYIGSILTAATALLEWVIKKMVARKKESKQTI